MYGKESEQIQFKEDASEKAQYDRYASVQKMLKWQFLVIILLLSPLYFKLFLSGENSANFTDVKAALLDVKAALETSKLDEKVALVDAKAAVLDVKAALAALKINPGLSSSNSDSTQLVPAIQPNPTWPPFIIIDDRNQFGKYLNDLGMKTGAELGVQKGLFTEVVLSGWTNNEKYYCVDLWAHQENYDDSANVPQAQQDARFKETKDRLRGFKTVEYKRMSTNQAAEEFKAKGIQLDWVYVDARHDYGGCWEDLINWWPIVRSGGILAGHDFENANEVHGGAEWRGDGSHGDKAVKGAVEDFSKKVGVQFVVTRREVQWPTWYMRKP